MFLDIVKRYLAQYSEKKDYVSDANQFHALLIYLEHSNDSRVFEILLSVLEDEAAPEQVRRLALCRLPFMGDRRGVDAVLRLRKKESRILPSLDEAMKTEKLAQEVRETPCYKKLKERWVARSIDEMIVLGRYRTAFGEKLLGLEKRGGSVTWAFITSSLAGFVEDVWALRLCDGEEPKVFYTGILGYTFKQSDMDRVLKDGVLSRDSDGDGWTDLLEHCTWTDQNKADTDGDGLIDSRDRNPVCAPRDLGDEEKIIQAAFEARFIFDKFANMFSVIELPEGMKPFELYCAPWATVMRGHIKKKMCGNPLREEAGTAITLFYNIDTDFQGKPIISSQRRWILWSADHREAKVHFFTYYGACYGTGFEFVLEKIGDEWFVKLMRLREMS